MKMKLLYTSTSPHARTCRIAINELGITKFVEAENVVVATPVSTNDELNRMSPLSKIPVLQVSNGDCLYDCRVIAEYLNALGKGKLMPDEPAQKLRTLNRWALTQGMMDLCEAMEVEFKIRPEALQWQSWFDHQVNRVQRTLGKLEDLYPTFELKFELSEMALFSALHHMETCLPELDWREDAVMLSMWYDTKLEHASVAPTL